MTSKAYTPCYVVDVQALGEADAHAAIEIFSQWFQFQIAQAKDVAFGISFSEFFYTDDQGVKQRNTADYDAHYFELYDVLVKHVPESILHEGIWLHIWW